MDGHRGLMSWFLVTTDTQYSLLFRVTGVDGDFYLLQIEISYNHDVRLTRANVCINTSSEFEEIRFGLWADNLHLT